MRLWHKDLIVVLPKKHLLAQWRECCAIASNINRKGTPNHMLVNKIMNYPLSHFRAYTNLIRREMLRRGYQCDMSKFTAHLKCFEDLPSYNEIFDGWHNDRYLQQCFYNLQEKYDCGAIPEEEWYSLYNYAIEKLRRHN